MLRIRIGRPFAAAAVGTFAIGGLAADAVLGQCFGQERQKLLASDGSASDNFGEALSLRDGFLVVGASFDDDNGTSSGSAYVYRQLGSGVWVEDVKLLPDDGQTSDQFGIAVASFPPFTVVGATGDDDLGTNAGAVYVFRRTADGTWAREAKITAPDGASSDAFGSSVAIDGTRIAVGSPRDDDVLTDSGSVYVFERQDNNTWRFQAKLNAGDPGVSDQLGFSVDLDGDFVIAGAPFADVLENDNGAAYVFRRQTSGAWTQEAKIVPAEVSASDQVGTDVALEGSLAAIGAPLDDTVASNGGAVYAYRRAGGGLWQQDSKLIASDVAASDQFGLSVDIDRGFVIGGSPFEDDLGSSAGAAYLFERLAVNT